MTRPVPPAGRRTTSARTVGARIAKTRAAGGRQVSGPTPDGRPGRAKLPAAAASRPRSAPAGDDRAYDATAGAYLTESERPWASLLFLLPFVLAYEAYVLGWVGRPAAGGGRPVENIIAFLLIEELFTLMGAAGRHLPAFTLVAMLLAAHFARRDPWRLRPTTLLGMAAESAAWAIPLVVLGWVMARYVPLAAGSPIAAIFSKCLGAGIYEEMLFRLIGVTVLSLILKDVLGLPNRLALAMVLLASGVLFSLYHYLSPYEHFRLRTFVFRAVAGGFFGLLYLLRGFGITAGTHTVYDAVVLLLMAG